MMLSIERGLEAGPRLCLPSRALIDSRSSCESVSRLNFVVVVTILEARDREDSVFSSSYDSVAVPESPMVIYSEQGCRKNCHVKFPEFEHCLEKADISCSMAGYCILLTAALMIFPYQLRAELGNPCSDQRVEPCQDLQLWNVWRRRQQCRRVPWQAF